MARLQDTAAAAESRASVLESTVASAKDQLLRLNADFDNFRRRSVGWSLHAGHGGLFAAWAGVHNNLWPTQDVCPPFAILQKEEKDAVAESVRGDVITQLLPLVDNFELARTQVRIHSALLFTQAACSDNTCQLLPECEGVPLHSLRWELQDSTLIPTSKRKKEMLPRPTPLITAWTFINTPHTCACPYGCLRSRRRLRRKQRLTTPTR